MELQSFFKYWGKAGEDGRYHLLPYHCLDVAAVGLVLLDPKKPLCQRLAEQLGVDPLWLRQWFAFCLSLHDIGKFATAFQGIVPGLSPNLVQKIPSMPYLERHDTLGWLLWERVLSAQMKKQGCFGYAADHPDMSRMIRGVDPWMEVVTGHHGEPPKRGTIRHEDFFTTVDEAVACRYLEGVSDLFLPTFEGTTFTDKAFNSRVKVHSWLFAGLAVVADWLGSGRKADEYRGDEITLDEYWRLHALPFATAVIAEAKLEPSQVASFAGIGHLFPFIELPTPLQQWAEQRPLAEKNQLFILEDVTGAGKTEAALILCHRLLAQGSADGLYVALPTMATANAMYDRLGKAYRRLYAQAASPSLVLAHGARHLSAGFRTSVGLPETSTSSRQYSEDEEPGEAYCSVWLADSRKKALLAEVGVGTLDQALLAVLPARHQSLRCLGLARKILIVDEVHAYDPYMNQLLQTLLETHARQGGSAILLSATLPQQMREKYLQAFCIGAGTPPPELTQSQNYPLAIHYPAPGKAETALPTRPEVERTVSVVMLEEIEQALSVIQEAVEKGRCVCWVRNTVGDAVKAYRLVARQEWIDKERLSLFHSRFAMIDRQKVEAETLDFFGEKSTAEMRRGRVLIATQVVEQSLDLDFDAMISDLAPIDLLIQRAGREHRHVRDAVGNRLRMEGAKDRRKPPVFHVFGPPVVAEPGERWLKDVLPGTQAVYKHVGQLWLTQQRLCDSNKISMPGDARLLIEGVYGEDAQESIPESLRGLSWDAEGEAGGKRGMARLNALKLAKGYTRSSAEDCDGWAKETRIPTRLGDDSVSVALARIEGDSLQPYATANEFAWDMSMLSLPRRDWRKAQQLIPAGLQPTIAQLKDEVRALKWVEVLPLTPEILACYDSRIGWGLGKEDKDESD